MKQIRHVHIQYISCELCCEGTLSFQLSGHRRWIVFGAFWILSSTIFMQALSLNSPPPPTSPPQVSARGVNTPLVFFNFFTNICISRWMATDFSERFENELGPHCCLCFRVTEEMFHGKAFQTYLFQLCFRLTQRELTRKSTIPFVRIRCSVHVNSETLLLFRAHDSRFRWNVRTHLPHYTEWSHRIQ